MMTTATTEDPAVYTWGRSAQLRAYRDYLGLGTEDMAERLGMARRQYQRIEIGQSPIPPGLFDSVRDVMSEHETAVVGIIAAVNTIEFDTEVPVIVDRSATSWERSIASRAMIRCSRIVPMTRADKNHDKITEEKST